MKKKRSLAELIKGSFIIGWLITLADFLYERIPKSAIARFFSDYEAFSVSYSKSLIGGIIGRFKPKREKTVETKRKFSSLVENSFISRSCTNLKRKLLTARLRTYGTFILAYGIVSACMAVLNLLLIQELDTVNTAISCACVLGGLVLIFSKKPIGQALYDSLVFGLLLSKFAGIRRDEVVFDTTNDRGITLSLFFGVILGLTACVISPALLFGAIFALILLSLIASKPEFGITFIAFSLPFLPTMAMCGIILFCTGAFILKVARGKRTFRFEAIDLTVLIFMAFTFFGGAVSVSVSDSIKAAAVFVSLMFSYFLIANLIRNRALTRRILYSFVCSMFITALIGLYQKFFMSGVTTWHDTSMFEDIGTRIFSTFQNPNVYGEYLVMSIPLSVSLLFTQKTFKERFPCFIMTAAALLALVYTQSRGAWLAFIISMAIYLLIRTGRTMVVFLFGILAIPLLPFILPESIVSRFMSIGDMNDGSTFFRVAIWRAVTNMFRDYFAGGIGIGTAAFSKVYPAYSLPAIESAPHSHHLFFQIIIEMGIFALFAFIAVIFVLIRKNSHGLMKYGKNDYTLISSAALCGIVGMLLQGLTDYVWYNYRVFGMFWIIIGLCVASLRCAENQTDNQERII